MNRFIKGVVIVASALLVITLSACSAKSSLSSGAGHGNNIVQSNKDQADGFYGHGPDNTNGTAKYANISSASSTASTSSAAASTDIPSAVSRKIVKSADISLTTLTYDKSVAAVERATDNYGGFVQNSVTQGDGASGNRSATFTVRVPTAKFSEFLDSIGNIGKVVNRSVKGEDVTQQYLDTSTKLSTLKIEQARLADLMSKATKMSDILEIEQKLSDIETSIEQNTGELKKMDSLVDLSTVNISISEVKKGAAVKPDTFSGTIANIFTQSINALVMTGKIICYVIVAISPFALIIGIGTIITLLFRRRHKKSDEQKPADEHNIDDDGDK